MRANRAVRVAVVDDDNDVRALVRATLGIDDRFEVVGEAANGEEAIQLVASTPVDLVVLDRDMPVMDGLTALPIIHERAPGVAVIVYTARSDLMTRQAALAAGAVDIVDKVSVGLSFLERVADALVSHWGDEGSVQIQIGPVPSDAVVAWVDNSQAILDAVTAPGAPVSVDLDPDDERFFRDLLALWRDLSSQESTFYWTARASAADVDRAVRAWTMLDDLTDEQIAELGCRWSPPEARPFFEALTGGVVSAIARHEETRELAETLRGRWT